jgi:hypothetical protein
MQKNMVRMKLSILFCTLFILTGFNEANAGKENISESRSITLFTSYGYLDNDDWVIPVRVWVYEPRSYLVRVATRISRSFTEHTPDNTQIFRNRIRYFAADSKSRRSVTIQFPGDSSQNRYLITDERGNTSRTGMNGHISGYIRLPADHAEKILESQQNNNGWLRMNAVSRGIDGSGYVQLIEPEGVSVISDIDDTVKITEIPAGSRVVVRNTFYKEFSAAPHMAEMYQEWDDAAFHYVSGAPWQLYRPLSQFLISEEENFPMGSFHMKTVNKNLLSINTWRGLRELTTNEMITYDQKIEQITRIMEHFPDRDFILVGDSGERDPEVYRHIKENFPDQVEEIIIRDVVNHRNEKPERLEGMTILPAPTISRETVSEDVQAQTEY